MELFQKNGDVLKLVSKEVEDSLQDIEESQTADLSLHIISLSTSSALPDGLQ